MSKQELQELLNQKAFTDEDARNIYETLSGLEPDEALEVMRDMMQSEEEHMIDLVKAVGDLDVEADGALYNRLSAHTGMPSGDIDEEE